MPFDSEKHPKKEPYKAPKKTTGKKETAEEKKAVKKNDAAYKKAASAKKETKKAVAPHQGTTAVSGGLKTAQKPKDDKKRLPQADFETGKAAEPTEKKAIQAGADEKSGDTPPVIGIKGQYTGTFTAMPSDFKAAPLAGTGLLYAKTLKEEGLTPLTTASLGELEETAAADVDAEAAEVKEPENALPMVPSLLPPPEKKKRGPIRQFFATIWGAFTNTTFSKIIGQTLYNIGFTAEFRFIQFWRLVKEAGIFLSQIFVWLFGRLFGSLGRFFKSLGHDIAAPFVRFKNGIGNMRALIAAEKKNGKSGFRIAVQYFASGIKNYGHLLMNFAGLLMPAAAALVLVFTVHSLVNKTYALAVEVDGEVLGYVTDQVVIEDAKNMLRMRLRLAKDQDVSDWQFRPDLRIATTENYSTTTQLVNAILKNGAGEGPNTSIVQGTGLYIDGDLYAVTTEGERLAAYLKDKLASQVDPNYPDADVRFVKNIVCEPNPDDVFLEASVEDFDTIVNRLNTATTEEIRYTADGVETLGELAVRNGVTLEALLLRNPQFAEEDDDFIPEANTSLLIRNAQSMLQVLRAVRVSSIEEIPFETKREETDKLAMKVERVIQKGENGLQEVYDDYIYIDGELVSTTRIDELTVVKQEPVDKIVQVGTYDFSQITSQGYNSAYMFPVPDATYSSRGMSAYHRGMDINAPTGTPILAANAGTVITAGSHYSYGNYVMIQHEDGIVTLYAHCSTLNVSVGDVVQQGQYIAAVGSTGMSTGPHCHLEFQMNGSLLNPANYVVPPWA